MLVNDHQIRKYKTSVVKHGPTNSNTGMTFSGLSSPKAA
jgi:hypothetical protein